MDLEVKLGGDVAVDVEADGFAHELLGDAEILGKLPDFRISGGDGGVQVFHGNDLTDGPFVGPVLVPLSEVEPGMAVIEAAG